MKKMECLILAAIVFLPIRLVRAEPPCPGCPNQNNGSTPYIDPYTGRLKIPVGGGTIDSQTGRLEPYGHPRPDYNRTPSNPDSESKPINNQPSLPSSVIQNRSSGGSTTSNSSKDQADAWERILGDISIQIKGIAAESKNRSSDNLKNQVAITEALKNLLIQKLVSLSDAEFQMVGKTPAIRLTYDINHGIILEDHPNHAILQLTIKEVSDAGFIHIQGKFVVYKPLVPADASTQEDLIRANAVLDEDNVRLAIEAYNNAFAKELARRNEAKASANQR